MITLSLVCFAFFSTFSQGLQKVKEKSKNPNRVFTYHVLENSQVKEGAAEIQYKGKLKDQELVKIETGAIPVLLGGDAKFLYFFANNIFYPHAAMSRGATGTVGVMVTITKEGEMIRPFIPKEGDKALDAEALREASLMPNDWIPLYLNGEATDCLVLFYLNFHMG